MIEPNMRSEPYKAKKIWWMKYKYLAKSILSEFPLIEKPIVTLWRRTRFLFWQFKAKLVNFSGYWAGTHIKQIDSDKVYWVSAQKIVYCSLKEFSIHYFKGRIIGGEWDRLEKKFEDLDIYHAIKQVCIDGKNWTETIWYQRELNELNNGSVLWGCRSESDFKSRCKNVERLFHNIKNTGYKSQHHLLQAKKGYDLQSLDEEITVSIGRNGDLLFSDGAHRLAIAKLLNIRKIPVKVAVMHSKWMCFKQELLL